MRGNILCNGNSRTEQDFIRMAAPWLLSSRHVDTAIQASHKVLLITAAWAENEYDEAHIKRALVEIGLKSREVDGFDVNLQNLGAWHGYREFCAAEPEMAAAWEARERLIEATRQLYLEKNSFYTALVRRCVDSLRARRADVRLSHMMADPAYSLTNVPASFDEARLFDHFLASDVRHTVEHLISNDDRMVELLHELEEHFSIATGLCYHPLWQQLRRALEERILSANSIILCGGTLSVLHHAINFFRLGEVMHEALRRGTSFFSVSAGSLSLCERIIIYNDFATELLPQREFQLFGRGFGLVRHLQIFPHCMDRIQTDNPDNLAYLAWRFQNRICVGLNEESLLLIEGSPRLRCTSLGEDGVYVFDMDGNKIRYDRGAEIPLG